MAQQVSEPELEVLDDLFFKVPLYSRLRLTEQTTDLLFHSGGTVSKGRAPESTVDGYCPHCGKQSTFRTSRKEIPAYIEEKDYIGHDPVIATCTRMTGHLIRLHVLFYKGTIEKIGQYPSLADISSDEVRPYRGTLDKASLAELHRAIGLATHGVGVGSFVYLRRIFERLIYGRFNGHAKAEGWDPADFEKLRMGEKITHLKAYLPTFLVENAHIYSIISKGIHELEEGECLAMFPVIKDSILMILDDDKRAKEAEAKRKELKAALTQAAAAMSAKANS